MAIVKIGPKHQVTIPSEVFRALNLKVGEQVEVQLKDRVIHLIPQKLIPKEQAWFWTKEWQEKEREADEAIVCGEVSGPFESVDALVKHLQGRK